MTVRSKAIIKILTGGFIFACVLYAVAIHGIGKATGGGFILIATAIPCVPFFIGVTEFLFGVPIKQVSNKWDDLQGWQRGVLGMLIVLATFAIATGLFMVAVFAGLI